MSKETRYTVTLDTYLYARTDREALVLTAKLKEFIDTNMNTDRTAILSVEKTPFASFSRDMIHKGNLTLFENKLIEV